MAKAQGRKRASDPRRAMLRHTVATVAYRGGKALRDVPPDLLDREALRADPSFLPIATDPAWVAFLNEPPAPSSERAPTPARGEASR